MKNKLTIESLIKISKSGSFDFNTIYQELKVILFTLKDQKLDAMIRSSLQNYFIVRLVSMIETGIRAVVIDCIDRYNFDPKTLTPNDEFLISVSTLNEIRKTHKISTGKIIANNFNFQRLDEIDSVLSKLLQGKTFLARFKIVVNDMTFISYKEIDNKEYSFGWDEFHNLFDIRHDIVHRLETEHSLDFDLLNRYHTYTLEFVVEAGAIAFHEYLIRNEENIKNNDSTWYANSMKVVAHVEDALKK